VFGYWAQSPIPNPQSPIPNPQYLLYYFFENLIKCKKFKNIMRIIKQSNYYLMLVLIFIQLLFFIYTLKKIPFSFLIHHLTNWSFLMSSIYLFLILIFDTNLYIFSSEKVESINFFIRNSYSKIAFPYCFLITIAYWFFLIFGLFFNINMYSKTRPKRILFRVFINTYLHLGITLIMLLDLFLTKRERVKFTFSSFIINTIIFIVYAISTYYRKFIQKINVYIFMEKMSLLCSIFVAIIVYVFLIFSFFIYMKISNKINYEYINEKENDTKYNIIKEQEIDDKVSYFNQLIY